MKHRRFALPAAALLTAITLTACGSISEPSESTTESTSASSDAGEPHATAGQPTDQVSEGTGTTTGTDTSPGEETSPATPTGTTFAVTVKGKKVGPNAQELTVAPGEKITITFDTDRGGQLHVHSKPDQYVDFPAGTSAKELVIKTPGKIEIEEHDSEAVVAVVTVK